MNTPLPLGQLPPTLPNRPGTCHELHANSKAACPKEASDSWCRRVRVRGGPVRRWMPIPRPGRVHCRDRAPVTRSFEFVQSGPVLRKICRLWCGHAIASVPSLVHRGSVPNAEYWLPLPHPPFLPPTALPQQTRLWDRIRRSRLPALSGSARRGISQTFGCVGEVLFGRLGRSQNDETNDARHERAEEDPELRLVGEELVREREFRDE